MNSEVDIQSILHRIDQSCPSGFAIAFHVTFTTPDFLFQTYAKEWMDYYSEHGLVMKDPVVAWGFSNLGTARWSDFEADDGFGVLEKARDYGIVYGAAYSLDEEGSRSFAGFARADREFTDSEIASLSEDVKTLHDITGQNGKLSPTAREALRKLSVQFTHPSGKTNGAGV